MSDVEFDKNQAVLAFAALAHAFGWEIGYQWMANDDGTDIPNRVMIFVNTPWGLHRWDMIPTNEMLGKWNEYKGQIPDDYNVHIRRIRVSKMIEALTAIKREPPKEAVVEQPVPQSPEAKPEPVVEQPAPVSPPLPQTPKSKREIAAQKRARNILRKRKKAADEK